MNAPATSLGLSPPAQHARGIALMLVSVAGFTANVLLVRALAQIGSANLWLISVARFLVGLAMIVTFYRTEFEPWHLFRRRKLIERGVLGGFGVYLTYLTVVKLGAGRAVFINNTYVIWGTLLAAWILREKLRQSLLVGSSAALLGLALMTNVFSTTAYPGFYDLVAIGAALLSAYIVVTIRQLHGTEHTSTIFAAQCVFGLALCSVPAILTYQPLSPLAWLFLLLASLTAGIAQITMTAGFRDLPVAEGSLLQMLVPLGVAAGGAVFFHEHFTLTEIIGAALILAGTAFTSLRR